MNYITTLIYTFVTTHQFSLSVLEYWLILLLDFSRLILVTPKLLKLSWGVSLKINFFLIPGNLISGTFRVGFRVPRPGPIYEKMYITQHIG